MALQDFSAKFVKAGSTWYVMTSKRVDVGDTVLVSKRGGTTKRVVITDGGELGRDTRGNTGYWFHSFQNA